MIGRFSVILSRPRTVQLQLKVTRSLPHQKLGDQVKCAHTQFVGSTFGYGSTESPESTLLYFPTWDSTGDGSLRNFELRVIVFGLDHAEHEKIHVSLK